MPILVTGASGFLGKELVEKLLERGLPIYGLSRHPPARAKNLIPLIGDITEPDLGLKKVPENIDAVYHMAAIHRLGGDKDGSIWKTNVQGTKNVIEFCQKQQIPHLYFTSTAYTIGRNTYEKSKILCEAMVSESKIPRVTIFKPSIVLGTKERFYPGHFAQFVLLLIKIHQRAELVRRKIEGSLRLPVIEPVCRIKGNPDGRLNLIQIDQVAWGMANIQEPGTFWLTHPLPLTLRQLTEWIGELIMVQVRVQPEFKPTPIELMLQKMATAFEPYLNGDAFPSNLQLSPPVTKEFIHETIKRAVLDQTTS